jgi:hypothetical protein
MQSSEDGPLLRLCDCDIAQNFPAHLRELGRDWAEYRIQTQKVSDLLRCVVLEVEGLVNLVLNQIDALLTLTAL